MLSIPTDERWASVTRHENAQGAEPPQTSSFGDTNTVTPDTSSTIGAHKNFGSRSYERGLGGDGRAASLPS